MIGESVKRPQPARSPETLWNAEKPRAVSPDPRVLRILAGRPVRPYFSPFTYRQ